MRRPEGRIRGRAAIALALCVPLIAVTGCGGGEEGPEEEPPTLEPVGELGGPTVSLDERGSFENILALDIDTGGEGLLLVAGQVEVGRRGAGGAAGAEVRILVDGEMRHDAEARSVGGDLARETLIIACGCELGAGLHEIEFQGRATGGVSVPITARSLVAVDGIEYDGGQPQASEGPLPAAVNGATLQTGSVLVTDAPTELAELQLSGGDGDSLLALAQVSAKGDSDPQGLVLDANVGGEPAELLNIQPGANTKLDTFLAAGWESGDTVDLLGRIVGGGNAEFDVRSVITCPCGIATG